MSTLTYLQPGMCVLHAGRPCRVEMVNDCRARLRPLHRVQRTVLPATGARAGQAVTFTAPEACFSISPNSELPIL